MVAYLSPEWLALQETCARDLPERKGATARLQHVITGAPDGEVAYSVLIVDGRVVDTMLGRDDAAADCTFLETYADALRVAKGELDLHAGFMQGRIKMVGDMGKLMAVMPLTQSDAYAEMLRRAGTETDF